MEKSLIEHYGDEYSMRCLQSSVVISRILNDLGIKSREFFGAVCVSQVFEDSNRMSSWNGFWGDSHHVWTITEYNELVDLSIGAIHAHPKSKEHKQVPMPPLWWSNIEYWPYILRYLPEGPIKLNLSESETKDIEEFTARTLKELEKTLNNKNVNSIEYSPILCGKDSLNELYESGHLWMRGSYLLHESRIPPPVWVSKREGELREKNC